jgi:hypothetical protein
MLWDRQDISGEDFQNVLNVLLGGLHTVIVSLTRASFLNAWKGVQKFEGPSKVSNLGL